VEAYIGKPIVRLGADYSFDHYLDVFGGYLPSPQARWCTKYLKLIPLERYVGEDQAYTYVAIRADEEREGYISHRPNLTPRYPFKEDGVVKADVYRILEESGLGLPDYYEWRTRSGCYFCFFQRKAEWIGLKQQHPKLFESAKAYEKIDDAAGVSFTWSRSESLEELESREATVMKDHARSLERESKAGGLTLVEVFENSLDAESDDQGCLICHL
jgi:3'-phosphoadenosine 5'-phosphosulfate sulfotransferase (PAPS reductase)/FAD synthetase